MQMLQIFPRIYEGETLYSIAARMVLNDTESSFSQSMLKVFTNKNIQLDAVFPSYLRQLSSVTTCSIEHLVDNHSLLQYYTSFATESVRSQAREFLKAGDSNAAYKSAGLLANRIQEEQVHKYCPKCVDEQVILFGEAIWLSEHQAPLTSVCLRHKNWLVVKRKKRKVLVFPDTDIFACGCTDPLLIKIAEFNHYLVKGYVFDPTKLKQTYAVRLINKGLATTKTVRHIKWRNEMRVYFSSLMHDERVRGLLNDSSGHGFPASVFYQYEASHHSIKHILIISFLFKHFGDFIVAYEQGESLLSSKAKPTTPQANIDEERHSKTLKLLKSGMSLRDVIRHANVSAATVRSIANKHGIALHENNRKVDRSMRRSILIQLIIGKPTQILAEAFNLSVGDIEQVLVGQTAIKTLRQRIRFYTRRKIARQAIISALYTLVKPSISRLRKAVDKEYMWLYKHDREWLSDFKNTYFDNK